MEPKRAKKQKVSAKVDLSYLQDLADGDDNFVNEVISMFLADAPDVLKQLMLYNKTNNYPLMRTSIHKLKSSLRMLGNNHLSDLAQDIEDQLIFNKIDLLLPTTLVGFVTKTSQFLDNLTVELESRTSGTDK